jgi:hypothetical protein
MDPKTIVKKLIITSVFLMLFISGCLNNSIPVGTYYHNETKIGNFGYITQINESLTIYNDNTFLYRDLKNDISSSGVITKHDDTFVFSGQLGISFTGKFQNDSIVTDRGYNFIKYR